MSKKKFFGVKNKIRLVAPFLRHPQSKHISFDVRETQREIEFFNHQLICRGNQVIEYKDGRIQRKETRIDPITKRRSSVW